MSPEGQAALQSLPRASALLVQLEQAWQGAHQEGRLPVSWQAPWHGTPTGASENPPTARRVGQPHPCAACGLRAVDCRRLSNRGRPSPPPPPVCTARAPHGARPMLPAASRRAHRAARQLEGVGHGAEHAAAAVVVAAALRAVYAVARVWARAVHVWQQAAAPALRAVSSQAAPRGARAKPARGVGVGVHGRQFPQLEAASEGTPTWARARARTRHARARAS